MTAASLSFDEARDLLFRALHHDAVEDAVTEVLFEHVVGGRYERSEMVVLLRLKIQDVLLLKERLRREDWQLLFPNPETAEEDLYRDFKSINVWQGEFSA